MAKKIIKALGIGKKKAVPDTAVAPAVQKGPIVKQLGPLAPDPRKRRAMAGLQGQIGTILSDKLGA